VPELTLEDFHNSELPLTEMILGRMDYVHELFLTFEYEPIDELPVGGDDLVVLVGSQGRRSKLRRLAVYKGRLVLVTAGSDYSFGGDILPRDSALPPHFTSVFAINNDSGDARITNVPLGVRVETAEHCRAAIGERDGVRDKLLYGNFNCMAALYRPTPDGKRHIRRHLAEQFENAPWTTMDLDEHHRTGAAAAASYYKEVARHKFVLSPEGLGADCYRHWECLYLGAIPIVQASPAMAPFSDLPILFTEDFSEIDQPYLEAQWERFRPRHFELNRLMKSFYEEHFLASVARLSNPRFLSWGLSDAGRPETTHAR
jgi:hypothetical protein